MRQEPTPILLCSDLWQSELLSKGLWSGLIIHAIPSRQAVVSAVECHSYGGLPLPVTRAGSRPLLKGKRGYWMRGFVLYKTYAWWRSNVSGFTRVFVCLLALLRVCGFNQAWFSPNHTRPQRKFRNEKVKCFICLMTLAHCWIESHLSPCLSIINTGPSFYMNIQKNFNGYSGVTSFFHCEGSI